MLNKLRWQLTFTYIIATLALVVLMGGGSYYVLERYLRTELDLALKHGMAGQFSLFGLSLPASLEEAEQDWANQQTRLVSNTADKTISANQPQGDDRYELEDDDDDDGSEYGEGELDEVLEHGYGSQLISIFTMPLDDSGAVIFNPNPYSLPMQPDQEAFQAAMQSGSDIRTVELPSGQRVRLLTYRTGGADEPTAFQLGRIMLEQDRALRQLLAGILMIGTASLVIVGLGSWRLAGASLLPAQKGLDQQQAFVANASHELRTPLTLIRASTEMALRKNENPLIQSLLTNVIEEADYMNHLVADLLLLTRLDADQIKLDFQPVNLSDLLKDAGQQLLQLAEKKGLQIKIEPLEKVVVLDAIRMRQVLLIILDNAINHTPPGGSILFRAAGQDGSILIEIQDTGEGIPAEHLPHIFERFYQVETTVQGDQRSNGLGLSIARNLVELHQGRISARSTPGQGTTISITLPADQR